MIKDAPKPALLAPAAPPQVTVKFQKLFPSVRLPRTWSSEAIGYDLHAYIIAESGRPSKTLVPPNSTINVATGLLIELPTGYFGLVCPRSGLGKRSISVTNSPGIIDPDYRGEVRVLVYNGSYVNHWIEHDTRIAQLVVMPVTRITIQEVSQLSETARGRDGFGSTGD